MAKKLTPNQAAYKKELRRIERFMKSAEKRGFTFLTEIPEAKAKPTKRDVERLKKLTPEKLYRSAYYTDETGERLPASPQRGGKWKPTKSGEITVGGQRQSYQEAMRAAIKRARRQEARRKALAKANAARKEAAAAAREEKAAAKTAGYQNIIDNLKEPLISFTPSYRWDDVAKQSAIQYHNFFERVLEAAEGELGSAELAKRIQANGLALHDIIDEMLYKYYHTAEEARFNLNRFVKIIMGKDANIIDYSPGSAATTISDEVEYYTALDGSGFGQEYAVRGYSEGHFDYSNGAPVDDTILGSDIIKVQGGIISIDEFLRGGGVTPVEKP